MIRLAGFIFVAISLLASAECANILGIFTSPMPSHAIVHLSLAKALAEKGHNLTIVTVVDPPIKHKNFNLIQVPLSKEVEANLNVVLGDVAKAYTKGLIASIWEAPRFFDAVVNIMENALTDPRVKGLYENRDNKFDLMIVGYLSNNFQLGIAQKLKVPVIGSFPQQPLEFIAADIGNPRSLSHVPGMVTVMGENRILSFSQRLHNMLFSLAQRVITLKTEWDNRKRYRNLFGDDSSLPDYDDLAKNISLIFFNSYGPSEGPIRPNVPAVVEIGGIQIKDKPNPLPANIAEFLDNATEGAILLSFGSNMKASHLAPKMVQSMFRVLSKLRQRVIWKWEDLDNAPGSSENILYSKWLPQDDILAHPSIKLFITHAGRGGIAESQYHGRPMLAIPFFGDQGGNAGSMVKLGFGLTLSPQDLDEENFKSSIVKLLENPSFTQNVKSFSDLYRDRPLTAQETVVFWTEYVLRHQGAPHLQSPVVHMSFIAAHNIDLYLLFVSVVIVVFYLTLAAFRLCKRRLTKVTHRKIKAN